MPCFFPQGTLEKTSHALVIDELVNDLRCVEFLRLCDADTLICSYKRREVVGNLAELRCNFCEQLASKHADLFF